jgi:hypothetical protein
MESTELAPDNGRYVTLEEYWEKWYESPYPHLDDLHRRPRLADLARDPVYSDYVIPELQVAVSRAEKAEEQAEEQLKALEAELARLRNKSS